MEKFKKLADWRMLISLLLGFSSGLPLLLTGSTLQAWLKESGFSLGDIGLVSLFGIPYTLKFMWSPILDWIVPPMGRRRGWLLISQIGLAGSLVSLSFCDPKQGLWLIGIFALLVTFMSATQDIAIDAFILELLPAESYGLGSQFYVLGYRIGMYAAGMGSLILADLMPWKSVYQLMAIVVGVGMLTTFFAPEPKMIGGKIKNFSEAVIQPLKDFFFTAGSIKGGAFWLLAFFILYNLCSNMTIALTTPYYKELGYTNTIIGVTAKGYGITATIVGGIIGGAIVVYIGVKRALWLFGIIQGVASLSFAWLGYYVRTHGEATVWPLATAISIENVTIGLATAAYTTFMGLSVNKKYTATQYALLSSLMGIPRIYMPALSGFAVEQIGWHSYYIFCSFLVIPGLLVLYKISRDGNPDNPEVVLAVRTSTT